MSEADRRAYILADNKLALNAGWDQEILAGELQALVAIGFEVALTGFSLAEVLECEILASILPDQANNVVLQREIDFVDSLLQRLGPRR
jgi:hypothetical protein